MTEKIRSEFPLLKKYPDLVYLDSAATALKPSLVLEAEQSYSTEYGTNASRGLYPLAEKTSQVVQDTRKELSFLLRCEPEEIIFTRGTTDGVNLLARSLETALFYPNQELLVGTDAHHSLLLPLDSLAKKKGLATKFVSPNEEGFYKPEELVSLINKNTRILALTLASNVYGVVQHLEATLQNIRSQFPEIFILLDAAQAVTHYPLDVQKLAADAIVFSGHKLYGPTGIGVLYLKKAWQDALEPGAVGGGMVTEARQEPKKWKAGPEKYEAGTLPLAQIFGLRAAVKFVTRYGFDALKEHERELTLYAFTSLKEALGDNIQFLGSTNPKQKIGLISFTIKGLHPHDIASLLGERNICVRAGEQCASLLHHHLKLPATTRISFGVYTTKEDIDKLAAALKEARKIFTP